MKFSQKDAIVARNSFSRYFIELLDRYSEREKLDPNMINQIIDILTKLLIIIRKTHKPLKEDIFSNEALTGILNFVTVRNVAREPDFNKVVDKYEQSLKDAKRLSNIFWGKDNSLHDILSTLKDYIDNYSNTFSRSILFMNLQTLSAKKPEEIEKFFLPIIKNETALYLKESSKKPSEEIYQKIVETCYSTVFNILTKFCFDKEKQYNNLQKVFKESSYLIQTMVG